MISVYVIDFQQVTFLNLMRPSPSPKIKVGQLKNIIRQQGGLFFEMSDAKTLEFISENNFYGYVYRSAVNSISDEEFINYMTNMLFLDSTTKFVEYWESILTIDHLANLALSELATMQEEGVDLKIHISGNLTKINADWLNIELAKIGLKNINYTCSFSEGRLVDQEYVTNIINQLYPTTEYNIVDLRNNNVITPDLFKPNPSHTTAPRSVPTLTM